MSNAGRNDLVPAAQGGDPLLMLEARIRGRRRSAHADPDALRQVLERARSRSRAERPLLRMVHHMACTGGTLVSRALQAQPNTLVLSEVDPLSPIQIKAMRSRFAPTDPILLARAGIAPINDGVAVDMFQASVSVLRAYLDRQGRRLVLRSHAHSQFCTEVDWDQRPTLTEMFADDYRTADIVTVRHPLDSWLSLIANDWRHFEPFTLDEYARRYLAFLDRHEGIALFKYETFVTDPDTETRRMCDELDLSYISDWQSLISAVRLSGDSGRRGDAIMPRPRRDVPEVVLEEAGSSAHFLDLCRRLGYQNI